MTSIEVAVALPVSHTFTYGVCKSLSPLAVIGKRVLVPFGQRQVTGYILGQAHDMGSQDIKEILDILDEKPLFPPSMIPFFKWVADYYLYPLGEVIKGALPGGLNIYDFAAIRITPAGRIAFKGQEGTHLENAVLNAVMETPIRVKDISKMLTLEIPRSSMQTMAKRGWIQITRALAKRRTGPKEERFVSLIDSRFPSEASLARLSDTKKSILNILRLHGPLAVPSLRRQIPSAPRLLKSLEQAGYISIYKKEVYRDPFGESIRPDTPPPLSKEQKAAIHKIIKSFDGGFRAYLLAGVTGSGKTEVYLQLTDEVIRSGGNVLVLVPEIALISQMERRFRARFGECIAVLHSGLSAGERYDQWIRIMRQDASIVIGARSAIFAPFNDLGLIIVDEEHDTSYKQDSHLRYNAKDLAVLRARMHDCTAVLGSATPSIQSFFNAQTQKFTVVTLPKRVERRTLPEIRVVDLRQSKDARGFRRFITPELQTAIKETLARREQVILFLNRRGFANLPICVTCGEAVRCKNCDLALTLHKKANAFKCHYCGFSKAAVSHCEHCGSARIRNLGLGTEQVEGIIKNLFPDARVIRMDRDTTRRKGSILQILKGLKERSIDVIVGTQIIAKGHDFPNITLVGIISADLSLNFPDFRASERTFQLLAQVAGRAGRGDLPGQVILQTYNPNHFSILSAQKQNVKEFYQQEIQFRRTLNYPPYSRMIQLTLSGKDAHTTKTLVQTIGGLCQTLHRRDGSFMRRIEILGPIEAPLARIARYFRWQILFKGSRVETLHRFVRTLLSENASTFKNRHIKVVVDVDPMFMM